MQLTNVVTGIEQVKRRLFLRALESLDADLARFAAAERQEIAAEADALIRAGRGRAAEALAASLPAAGPRDGGVTHEEEYVLLTVAAASEQTAAEIPPALPAGASSGSDEARRGPGRPRK